MGPSIKEPAVGARGRKCPYGNCRPNKPYVCKPCRLWRKRQEVVNEKPEQVSNDDDADEERSLNIGQTTKSSKSGSAIEKPSDDTSEDAQNSTGGILPGGQWSCSLCTFINKPRLTNCAVCNAVKPIPRYLPEHPTQRHSGRQKVSVTAENGASIFKKSGQGANKKRKYDTHNNIEKNQNVPREQGVGATFPLQERMIAFSRTSSPSSRLRIKSLDKQDKNSSSGPLTLNSSPIELGSYYLFNSGESLPIKPVDTHAKKGPPDYDNVSRCGLCGKSGGVLQYFNIDSSVCATLPSAHTTDRDQHNQECFAKDPKSVEPEAQWLGHPLCIDFLVRSNFLEPPDLDGASHFKTAVAQRTTSSDISAGFDVNSESDINKGNSQRLGSPVPVPNSATKPSGRSKTPTKTPKTPIKTPIKTPTIKTLVDLQQLNFVWTCKKVRRSH